MSVDSILHDWNGRLYSGELAWSRNRFELSYRDQVWSLAYVQRYDYQLHFNDATADLYYREENDLPLPGGAVRVKLDVWHLYADGVKFAYRWAWENGLLIEPAVTLLRPLDFQDGSLRGELQPGSGLLSGTADLNYRYTEDRLLEHRFEQPSGTGATLDLTLSWKSEVRELKLQLQDLYGRVDWKDAPYTLGSINTVDRGKPAKVELEPAFSGVRGEENYRQKMPVYARAFFTETREGFCWLVDVDYLFGEFWLRPGLRWDGLPGNPYVGYEARDGQWLLGLSDDSSAWFLQLGSDRSNLHKARSLTVAAGFQVFL
ncbi:hypothetical protein [Microbulbifer thermotolerans]|uniref:Uncharacterized protein n=1 Tax=Microbulbifer thermotolerans TaxID=252514 RepID=A0A143HQ18_MICTH|nr:hypothetical protein [Microbulbifer thermotolerans]AMX03587.1 hypothetical protein A3224_14265 [Microbulbifer thermotolerans]MCX2782151.1 hypothetical protein [Microbulbifer thermotolerans]MCX2831344.1 hypothetical protein [Microbulbifer thermotolerans]MCX2835270.1 hypothetical protein [Microbulbifer thermotolerans]